MGIDHGLGGRESSRSKLRRDKKAKRIKATAKKLRSEGFISPKEIKFDEAARKEWLVGFRKRKQERRKFGLTMQVLKDKKKLKDAAKEKRLLLKQNDEKPLNLDANDDDDDDEESGSNKDENEEDDDEEEDEEEVFEDDATVSMFGSAVSVVVSDRIGEEDDNIDDGMSISTKGTALSMKSKGSVNGGKQLSRFEKAMKKAKQMMGNKKKKNHSLDRNKHVHKSIKKRVESNKLLDKALGRKLGHNKNNRKRR